MPVSKHMSIRFPQAKAVQILRQAVSKTQSLVYWRLSLGHVKVSSRLSLELTTLTVSCSILKGSRLV